MFLRSEDALDGGVAVPIETMWRLTQPWYADRLSPDFRRRSLREYQAMLTGVGLVGEFWELQ